MQPRTVLIAAAHPDDEVLGCGATAARLALEGVSVHVAIFGEGVTSRYLKREEADQTLVTQLRSKTERVGARLGVRDVVNFGLPDNRFDTVPLLDVIKIVEDLIDRLRPDVLYTHSGGDLNIDHLVLHRAVMTATRPFFGQSVRAVYAFEVASSTEWAFGQFAPRFSPNTFVDVSDTIEAKVEAMEMYESEARNFPHPRSPGALKATAQRWGSVAGLKYAEAFELIHAVQP